MKSFGYLSAAAAVMAMSLFSADSHALDTPYIKSYYQVSPCNGTYRMSWYKVPGATYYEVLASYSPGGEFYVAANPVYAYITVSVTDTTFYGVKACDGTSCSAMSYPVTLTYYNGCD